MTNKITRKLMAEEDVFAEEQQARQDELDALVNSLALPSNLQALQTFLAGDATQKDKIEQLVNFLADGPAIEPHDEPMPHTDIFADEQEKKQKKLDELVNSLSEGSTLSSPATSTTTSFLATDSSNVNVGNTQSSLLTVFGGAVLLLVAVVLAVMAKHSRSKHEKADEHKDFSYSIMYE